MRLYTVCNIFSIGGITLLKHNKIVLPIVIGYSLVDALLIKIKKIHTKRKENQLILHHCATVGLCVLSLKIPHLQYFIPKILEIEKSTLLVLLSKHTKLLKIPSMATWFFYRTLYFPSVAKELKDELSSGVLSHELAIGCVNIIEALGFVWTLEGLKVPKKFYRPCCMSMIYSGLPLLTHKESNVVKRHVKYLIINSVLHHSHHNNYDLTILDKLGVKAMIIHSFMYPNNNPLQFFLHILGALFLSEQMKKSIQGDTFRDYDSITNVLPHMAFHILVGRALYMYVDC